MILKGHLWIKFIQHALIQASNVVVPLVTIPYIISALGAEKYGVIVINLVLIGIVNLIVQWGFELNAIREVSTCRERINKRSAIFWTYLNAKIILLFFVCVSLLLLTSIFPSDYEPLTLMKYSILLVVANILNPIWYYNAINKIKKIYIPQALLRYLQIPLTLLLINDGDDVVAAILVGPSVSFFIAIYSITNLFMQKELVRYSININNAFDRIWASRILFLSAFASGLAQNIPVLVMGKFASYDQIALVGILERIRLTYPILLKSVMNTLYAYFTGSFLGGDDESRKRFKRLIIEYTIMNVIILSILSLLIMSIPYSTLGDFPKLKEYFPLTIIAIFCNSLNSLFIIQWFISRQELGKLLISVMISLSTAVISSFLLIPSFASIGTLISIIIAEVLTLFTLVIFFIRSRNSSNNVQIKET